MSIPAPVHDCGVIEFYDAVRTIDGDWWCLVD